MSLNLWQQFCCDYEIRETGVPLFNAHGNIVKTMPYGQKGRLLLQRSVEMEALIIDEVSKVVRDFEQGENVYEGLIYMMFWQNDHHVIPLYIGKSEKYGKQDSNLSVNIKNIAGNKHKFCRWGNGYDYHIGDLSAVVCPGHQKMAPKYKKWASKLFESFPSSEPVLKHKTYFWIHAWKTGTVGVWKDFGSTPLTSLEYQLIAIASAAFPEYLLNAEGVNRR
ncbi:MULTISPECIES: hypothetical protein [Leptolyngbya]|uniref:hypothetical protein n=1 Tax=Leptolyngbya TaxID=47251 RepID=UPI001687488F|nr:hypothetical protein [Leptolyngbya sp. FACHB-1624]MBD1859969.1 hypothetical protein [Leptolyngbya sp. FACHB-1624]